MRPVVCVFLFLLSISSIQAQRLSGTWVMAYIKAKQPVYTMTEKDGEMILDESATADSTITYNPGLMSMKILSDKSAVSYSWDGKEEWVIELSEGDIRFNGTIDTLFGQFNGADKLVLKSTIDEIPTEYVFSPLRLKKSKSPLQIENTSWEIAGDESFLLHQRVKFLPDSALISTYRNETKPGEYYIHPLNGHYAVEYVINTPDTNLGIIYITEIKKNRITGTFFPQSREGLVPDSRKIVLIRSKQ